MSKPQNKSSADVKSPSKDSTPSKVGRQGHKGSGHGPLSTKSAPDNSAKTGSHRSKSS